MATVNASVVSAFNAGIQPFYSIDFPGVNLYPNFIANVSKDNPAIVTTTESLPPLMANGDPILITNVGGMIELATAGYNGTNEFYVGIVDATNFALFTDQALNNAVDSSAFTAATANTGQYNTFTGQRYTSLGNTVPVVFPTLESTTGSDISLDLTTGEITLQADITYQIIVTGFPASSSTQAGILQLFDNGGAYEIGTDHPIGHTFFATVKPGVENTYQVLAKTIDGSNWAPSAGIVDATITITAVSGTTVA